jgi:hypothetical protein
MMGRCIKALVVKEPIAGITPSTSSGAQHMLVEWFETILGQYEYDVVCFLECPGAAELASMVFIVPGALGCLDDTALPSDVRDVAQQTLAILAQTAKLHLDQPITQLENSDAKFERIIVSGLHNLLQKYILCASSYGYVRTCQLRVSLECLWYCAKAYQQLDASEPSSAHFFSTLGVARPDLIHIFQTELDSRSRETGRFISALVVMKLMADIRSRPNSNVQIGNDELACLSTILGTESDDVRLCLECPGVVELATIVSIALGDLGSFSVSEPPENVDPVARRNLVILSQALPAENVVGLQPFTWDDIFNGRLIRTIVSNLDNLLQVRISGPSDLTDEVRWSCLRVCLKSMWYCAKAYNQPNVYKPLPSYFPSTLASPEMIRLIQLEQDPVSRATGHCFGALLVMKLVADAKPRTNSNVEISHDKLACLSTILGAESHDLKLWLGRPYAVELANILSLILSEIDPFLSDTVPSKVLDMMQQTYNILAWTLPAELSAKLTNYADGQCKDYFSSRLFVLNLLIRAAASYRTNTREPFTQVYGEHVALHESIQSAWDCGALTILRPHNLRQSRVLSTH